MTYVLTLTPAGIQVILKVVMLRRTKGSLVLALPPKTVKTVECPFNAAERDFYDALEHKLGTQLKELQRKHEVEKHWTLLMVLLLRLRQGLSPPIDLLVCD